MQKKIILACLALVAFAAYVAPTVASAAPLLTYPTGTTAPVGTKITAINEGDTLMTNSGGGVTVRCTGAHMKGVLTKNSGTEIEGNIESAVFTGSGSEGKCTSTFGGDTRVTTAVANGLPYCLRATSAMEKDEMQIRGGKCSEGTRKIVFTFDTTNIGECSYERATAIPGKYTTHPSQATASISKVAFKRIAGSFLCPAEGFLDMAFLLSEESTGGAVYID